MQLMTSGGWGTPVNVVLSSCRRTNSAGIVHEQPWHEVNPCLGNSL